MKTTTRIHAASIAAALALASTAKADWTWSGGNNADLSDPANWTGGLLYIGKWLIEAGKDVTDAQIRPGTTGIAHGAFRP